MASLLALAIFRGVCWLCVAASHGPWLCRDQYELQAAIDEATKQGPLSVHYLDKALFPNGCCCGHDLPSDPVQAQRWIMWHSACTGDITTKAKVLERIGSSKLKRNHRKGS